ncbi:aldehyde dehydrogenase [Singulisphaera acidiphila]|uniref:NAD-dependent aldehyde dehydrogenase n=1 Tax=Singulisphaera acidiphila (strain ATCC BAA-1392 / DSM 18658 / VKM B-2454 / MOB10) TaxID=886293 RepID=L0DBA1_SINAD|nr:aldehyde dehydrogenase [Singulisphaera acidiphila]AGA26140.1 NAD-dependent aldehyde dehydrogenase [Singulisphaera acidiphila DSM 18658]
MQMTEDLIRNVVQQVLSQMGGASPATNGKATAKPTGQWGIYPTADAAVTAAEAAFQEYRTRPYDDRKKAVECIKRICVEQAEELGRAELEETKIGRLDHKIAKLRDAIPQVPGVEYLRTDNASGDNGLTLTDYAPFGVIGAITPVTHSLPTLAGNAINMLASGNTVVFNAHPSGAKIAAEGVRRFNKAIQQAIGLDDLLTIIDPPTLESASALFDHRGVRLLVVTGGPAVARAALASKRRAVVAGPGNPPVVVDSTACLDNAARSIVAGAAFDNNLLCIGEKQVFAVADIFDKLLDTVSRNGGHRLNSSQIDTLTKAAFKLGDDNALHVNKDLVGQDAAVLARYAGVEVPQGTQIVFGETGADHPFVEHEQMMPFIPFVRVSNVDRAIAMAKQSEHGYGHTAVLHSRDTSVMSKMGKLMDCTVFVINGPSPAGLGLGGEGTLSFSIAGPTGEGLTTPLTFCRQRRTAVIGSMRFV